MKTYDLQQKRFASDKKKVHSELTNYFVNLDAQHKLLYFRLAIRQHSQSLHFTVEQAGKLVEKLIGHFGIRLANVESAIEFRAYYYKKSNDHNIIRFEKPGLTEDQYEMQIDALYDLIQNKTMEFQDALEMVVLLLNHYPVTKRVFGRHQSQIHIQENKSYSQAIHF